MRIFKIAILLLIGNVSYVSAQKLEKNYNLTTSIGYGTENNHGNTGFFAGLGVNRALKKKLLLEANLTYFTTAIYNAYKAKPTFYLNEDRRYNSLFLNLNLQYVIGNDNSLINVKIKSGPAINYYDKKTLIRALVYNKPENDLYPIVPGTEKYDEKIGVNISLYNGLSFDAKIKDNLRVGAFLDVYSGLIPVEHFMPGVYATFKLKNRN